MLAPREAFTLLPLPGQDRCFTATQPIPGVGVAQPPTIDSAPKLSGLELLQEFSDGQLVQLSILRMIAQPIFHVLF